MRTDLGRGHSRLRPPVVVTAAPTPLPPAPSINFTPKQGVWRRNNQRRPNWFLRPPVVIDVRPQVFYLSVTLARNRPQPTTTLLRPPAVVTAVSVFAAAPIATTFAPSPRQARGTVHVLRSPVVVNEAERVVYPPIEGHLFTLYQNRPRPTTHLLRAPTVVSEGVVFTAEPIRTTLVRIRPRRVQSVLRRPTDTIGLEDQGQLRTHLAPSHRLSRRASWLLAPPVVIDLSPQTRYLAIHLAYSRRGVTHSRLQPPVAVAVVVGVYADKIRVQLVRRYTPPVHSRFIYPIVVRGFTRKGGISVSLVRRQTPTTRSFLRPPVLAEVVEQRIYFGPKTTLVRTRPRPVRSVVRAPRVVRLAVEIYGPQITLARNKPKPVSSFLRPPTDTVGLEDQGQLRTTLAPSHRLSRQARSILHPPTVVFLAVEIYGPETTLVRIRPVPTQHLLRPPVVIDLSPQVYYLSLTLARNKPQPTTHFLRPPTDVFDRQDEGRLNVHLAYSRRGRPVYALHPPVVVDLAVEIYGPETTLAPSLRGTPKSHLQPPTVVFLAVEIYGPEIHLVRIRPVATTTLLRPPVVIDLRPQTYFLTVTLAPSHQIGRQRHYLSILRPPRVVQARTVVFFGPLTTLAYSRRGRPKSILRLPRVIDLRPQTRFLRVKLTYSRRGRAKSRLFNFVVRDRFFGPSTTLTYSRRGRPLSVLHPPVVVRLAVEIYGPEVTLTPSKRGLPHSFLRPPAVVGRAPFAPLSVNLTYSRRGRPVYELRPPTRVQPFIARTTQVTLAPQSRRPGRVTLVPPAVVRAFVAPPLTVTLARNKPQPTTWFLRPPTVVDTPEPVLYPIAVTLAYSLRGRPMYFYTGIVKTVFVPDEGEVCGDDEAVAEVCGDDEATAGVSFTEEVEAAIQGSDTFESRICGDDATDNSVLGGDEQAT